ncbi:MAG: dTDP-4-dehydrorhamnose reductase [Rhodobacteraceae bacterium]|nr:dTDP-4-dehydrorhamnose reductase [Paracoccaceae bacterium]
MTGLVFGKTGQVATELARRAAEDTPLIFLGRDQSDLSDPAACAAAIKSAQPDFVLNAAAWTAVDKAEEHEAEATVINGDAPGAMAQACAALGIPFVHVSTDYVFDGAGTQRFATSDPVAPLGAYGRSKLAGERAVQDAGGAFIILRTSWVFSAHGANFVKTMLRLGRERDRLTVVADQIGGPTPAAAIADAMLTCAKALSGGAQSGVEHFAGAPDTSWAGFAREIMTRAGLDCAIADIPTADYPTPAQRPLNSRLDCSGLARLGLEQPDWQAHLDSVLQELESAS